MKTIFTIALALFATILTAKNPVEKNRTLLDTVFHLLETNLPNPAWIESKAYKEFKTTMYKEETLALSETAFYTTFQQERKNLPFSHFYLMPIRKHETKKPTPQKKKQILTWKAYDNSTAYLDVRSFSYGAEQMIKAVQEIGVDKFTNLIIDLRDNGGGTLDAPVVLGQFLTKEPIDAGVYLTRLWFEKEHRAATVEDINKFPFLQDFTYAGIMKMFRESAAFRMVVPGHDRPVFQGNVYILINNNTASACEPLIDLFQKHDIATLVGKRSAGAMLSASTFEVNEHYNVFIPIADYQTAAGTRIDKVGIEPDIEVDSDKALDYVLTKLIGK